MVTFYIFNYFLFPKEIYFLSFCKFFLYWVSTVTVFYVQGKKRNTNTMQKGTDLHLSSKVYSYTEVRLKLVPNWVAVHENLCEMLCVILVLLLLHRLILPVSIFMILQ